jgi:hypothetical protein
MLWTEVVAFSRTLKSGKQKEKKKKKRKIDYRLLKKSGSMLLNLIFLSISSSSWGYLGGGNCLYTRVKKVEVGEGGGEICFLVFLQFLLIFFLFMIKNHCS